MLFDSSIVAAAVPTNTQAIVDVPWLIRQLTPKPSTLRIVDVRDAQLYAIDHIPNAVNLPVGQTFNQYGDNTRIASLQQIRALLSNLGITNSDHLLLYDDGLLKSAAHVFWVLETYGHARLSVLDGGIAAWIDQRGEVTAVISALPKSRYLPAVSPRSLSTKLTTRLAIGNEHVVIVDSRTAEEYQGRTSKAKRKGHIPGATSIPWRNNLNVDSRGPLLKPGNELQSLYHFIDKSQTVIAYCNRGQESALTYLVMRSLGYRVSIYDGAWLEWGNDDSLPIETPPLPTTPVPRPR
ncbi:MAG: sulfurtransferase [Gammaproteobacteria bacterium]|nr:sulfurtransferase [Gammaproteobacteria bacterium]